MLGLIFVVSLVVLLVLSGILIIVKAIKENKEK